MNEINDTYYTPELEEFHNGFEYEFHGMTTGGLSIMNNGEVTHVHDPHIKIWDKEVFGIYTGEEDFYKFTDDLGQKWSVEIDRETQRRSLREIRNLITTGQIRVKYLDEDDIKEVGFTLDKTLNIQKGRLIVRETESVEWTRIVYQISDNIVNIEDVQGHLFSGKIKNKSELKKLLKWLRIP